MGVLYRYRSGRRRVVGLEIDREGPLVAASLAESSRVDLLDRHALATVERGQPFEPPPSLESADLPVEYQPH